MFSFYLWDKPWKDTWNHVQVLWNFAIIFFVTFVGEELIAFGFVGWNVKKSLRTTVFHHEGYRVRSIFLYNILHLTHAIFSAVLKCLVVLYFTYFMYVLHVCKVQNNTVLIVATGSLIVTTMPMLPFIVTMSLTPLSHSIPTWKADSNNWKVNIRPFALVLQVRQLRFVSPNLPSANSSNASNLQAITESLSCRSRRAAACKKLSNINSTASVRFLT